MKLERQPEVGFNNGITITFTFPTAEKEELTALLESIEKYKDGEEYHLAFGKLSTPRSMNANSYMWVLCDRIADVVKSTKAEIYRKAIKEVGVFSDVAVQEGEPCATLVSAWGANGIGYFSEMFNTNLTDSKGGKMKRVRLYEGSHNYSQAAMSRLIDWIVDEAKGLGIETMTPKQIEELKAKWNA